MSETTCYKCGHREGEHAREQCKAAVKDIPRLLRMIDELSSIHREGLRSPLSSGEVRP